jgi:predicted phage tail protein
MKKTDPIYADMIEFIERGGMVSYLQGLSIKSNFESLQKELGRKGIVRKKEQLDRVIDIWTDMFELSSRSAAYAITKRHEMSKGKSEEAATLRAVAYAKNLANFEQVGDFGKTMGAFFMFYRPAATGAVRAIEAVIPAFRTLEGAIEGLPQNIKDNPEALKTYKANYAARQANARITISASIGAGMLAYAMAQMLADDDELGRNKVEADNMQQWTRFARFHLPESLTGVKDYVIQIPWGFGLGAFAAAGAQIAGGVAGKGSMGDALWNIATQISLDSFIPIPVSRMDASIDPLPFFLDSVMPSTLRPILEFVINKNGLGQEIYSDKNRRMGDAYTGSDRIPEIYRDLARELANITGGAIDWSPNTIYFLANSYLDGISKIGELGYGTLDVMRGNKSFDAKKDLPLVGSFIGAKSNFDSREFTKVEDQIKDIERKLNMFKQDPEQYAKFVSNNPFAEILVSQYNRNVNGTLKRLREDLNTYRKMKLSQKDRKEIVDALTLQQNIIKRGMIEEFKAYGIKP